MAERAGPVAADFHRHRHEPARGDGLFNQFQKHGHLERLDEVIVGAGLGGFDRRLRRAMRGHHKNRQPRPRGMQFANKFQAVQPRQFQVSDDNVECGVLRPLQPRVAAPFHLDHTTFLRQHAAEHRHDRIVVLDEKYLGGGIHGSMRGKNDAKSCAATGLGLILKRALVLFNNSRGNRQTQDRFRNPSS